MKKFLVINPFGIGDVLFTTPVVCAIKENYPDSFIGYWCNERVQALLKDNPAVNKIFSLSRGDLKRIYKNSRIKGIRGFLGIFCGIRKERFDVSLDFSSEHRYSLIARLSGIKRRIGFDYKGRGRFLTDKIEISGYDSRHVVEYYLDLLKPLDIKAKDPRLFLNVSEAGKANARDLLKRFGVSENDFIVGIAPGAGASWGKDASAKHWPALKFAKLCDSIAKDLGAKVLILGDASERPIADMIINAALSKPADLVGRTSLEELAAVISRLRILVTNDGGPMHIAVALKIKTVAIFGPVDDLVYGPYPAGNNHIVVKKDIKCRPCYHDFKLPVCGHKRACVGEITVEEVLDAVRSLS